MTGYDPAAYRDYFEHEFTYLNGFRRNTHRYAERVAIRDPETGLTLTYGELGKRVDRLAAGLMDAGVRAGDVVVYQLYNSTEFAEFYLATQICGAIGSPINYRLAPGEVAYVLDDSEPVAFVYDATLHDAARTALDTANHRPSLVAAAGDETAGGKAAGGTAVPDVPRFSELYATTAGTVPGTESAYQETTRLYTSGTTGMPKGVPLNSLVEVLTAHDVIMQLPLTPEDRTLNMTPFFHRGGLYCAGPNTCFYVGAQVVPMRAFDPQRVLDLVEQEGLTYLVGAPTNLSMLAAAQADQPRDLSTLNGIVTMGAPLEREACLYYQRQLCTRIFNGYGTTEAFWNTMLRPSDLPQQAGSAGRACVDDDVAVVRVHDDRLAAPDEHVTKDNTEIGEVVVRSPKSGMAYANAPEQEAAKFHNGWLYIGDLATWDEHEYVTIIGRKDDMIVSGGENIHPVQVEEALDEHPGVADALVVSVSDATWGQLVVAFVVPTDDSLTTAECDRHCREHPMLADYKRPRAYRFVGSLPLTATGKKVHYRAREQAETAYAAGLFEPVGPQR